MFLFIIYLLPFTFCIPTSVFLCVATQLDFGPRVTAGREVRVVVFSAAGVSAVDLFAPDYFATNVEVNPTQFVLQGQVSPATPVGETLVLSHFTVDMAVPEKIDAVPPSAIDTFTPAYRTSDIWRACTLVGTAPVEEDGNWAVEYTINQRNNDIRYWAIATALVLNGVRDPCAGDPCGNSGVCQRITGFCACQAGTHGRYCELGATCSPRLLFRPAPLMPSPLSLPLLLVDFILLPSRCVSLGFSDASDVLVHEPSDMLLFDENAARCLC